MHSHTPIPGKYILYIVSEVTGSFDASLQLNGIILSSIICEIII